MIQPHGSRPSIAKISLCLAVSLILVVFITVQMTTPENEDRPTAEADLIETDEGGIEAADISLEDMAIARVEWLKLQGKIERATKKLALVDAAHRDKQELLREQIETFETVVLGMLSTPPSKPTSDFSAAIDSAVTEVEKLLQSGDVEGGDPPPDALLRAKALIEKGQHAQALDVLYAILGQATQPPATRKEAEALFDRTIESTPEWWLIEPVAMVDTVSSSMMRTRLFCFLAWASQANGNDGEYTRLMERMVKYVGELDSTQELLTTSIQTAMWMSVRKDFVYSTKLADIGAIALPTFRHRDLQRFFCGKLAGIYARAGDQDGWDQYYKMLPSFLDQTLPRRDYKYQLSRAHAFGGRADEAWEMLDGSASYHNMVYICKYAALDGQLEVARQAKRVAISSIPDWVKQRQSFEDTEWGLGMICETEAILGEFEKAEPRIRTLASRDSRASTYGDLAVRYALADRLSDAKRVFLATGTSTERAEAAYEIGRLMARQNIRPAEMAIWLQDCDENHARYSAAAGVFAGWQGR